MGDTESLNALYGQITKYINYICLVIYSIQFFFSLYTLCLVALVRKQKEVFIVGIPLCFVIAGGASATNYLFNITSLNLHKTITYLTAINNFSFPFAQWLFGLQYFQTSLILPKLLINGRANALIKKIRKKLFE